MVFQLQNLDHLDARHPYLYSYIKIALSVEAGIFLAATTFIVWADPP